MKTHWKREKMKKKPPPPIPIQKENNQGTFSACKASHRLHAIFLPKTVHHRFWPSLMAGAEFLGT
jgi:hypothetical protein